jgi:general secretion pathway protein G
MERGSRDRAKYRETEIFMGFIATELEQFNLDCKRYPTTEEGLLILTNSACGLKFNLNERYLKDAWNNPFSYSVDGKNIAIISYGKDGKPGGEAADADIVLPVVDKSLSKEKSEANHESK